ncbi:MAG: FtsX-like permease family protein, partial [Longimicrobiales bacterium]
AGVARARLRAALVGGEVALALVLLIGAGLLVRSWFELVSNPLGFEPRDRVAIQLFIWDRNPTEEQRLQRTEQLLAAFEATPGVEDAAMVTALPFHPHAITIEYPLAIQGRPIPREQERDVFVTAATPDYFRIMGIPLARGRMFDETDRMGTPYVAVVNESFVRQYFPDEDAIGQVALLRTRGGEQLPHRIIGVVGDVRPVAYDSEPRPELWAPHAQWGTGSLTFVARVRGDAGRMVGVLREKVWQVDPGQTVYHAASIETLVADTLAARRFSLLLLGIFSLVALALAAIGLYGLISYATQQRAGEIGVRMALGAERGQIVRMIVSQGLRLALPGVVIGIIAASLLVRLLEGMLYEVEPTDPLIFTQLALLVLATAALASWLPARRATSSGPLHALREE